MPVYSYTVKIDPTTLRSGTIEAENERSAVNKLLLLNYHPLSVTLFSEKKHGKLRRRDLRHKELYIFLRQLANLNLAGLSLVKSLNNLALQNRNPVLQELTIDLREKIQKGKTFSEALADHAHVFSPFEINMIKSAEATGTLPEVIEKIADLKEKDIAFSYRMRSALAYPLLLISVGTTMLFILTTFVLPRFVSLFEDLGQRLPLITRLLISVSLFCNRYWGLLIGLFAGCFYGAWCFLSTERGRCWFDGLQLRIPLIRTLVVKVQTARFARTLGSLIENGIPIVSALAIVGTIATNRSFAQEINHAYTLVSKGQHVHEALKNSSVFEKNTMDLIAVGEESGKLEEMLLRIAAMNENEASQQIETMLFMLEPALIVVLGGIIAVMVMAILLPIFQMNFLIQ
jgi:general secretion pathway protein F